MSKTCFIFKKEIVMSPSVLPQEKTLIIDPDNRTPDTRPTPFKPKLLIIADDDSVGNQLKWEFRDEYEVALAGRQESAIDLVKDLKPQVVIMDFGQGGAPMETGDGLDDIPEILALDPFLKLIVISNGGDKAQALRAVGHGVHDFLDKPIEMEELRVILKRAFSLSALEKEYRDLQWRQDGGSFEGMLGTSQKMQEVFAAIRKLAMVDIPVLITGESGTGKELVAHAIHRLSERREGPFVVINCTAIPETLLESKLFGHEKGAITGAHNRRKGRVELARKGTLFLDEIGDLTLPLQAKLLRFLQERFIERIGGREQIRVETRILVASKRDLKEEIRKGFFREDLYYRLGGATIPLPPLREREGDILFLAHAFFSRYAAEKSKKIKGFNGKAVRALEKFPWHGNVRQLENRIKRAVIMAEGSLITPKDLELDSFPLDDHDGKRLKEAREDLERNLIKRSLAKHKGNVSHVASELGISRPTLYELISKLGIVRR